MHISLPVLLAIAPFSSAFYPYLPPPGEDTHPRRGLSHNDKVTERSILGHSSLLDSKTSPRAISHPREANNERIRMSLHKLRVKRANAFTIIRATTPIQENSAGIDQDGTDFSYFCSFKLGTSSKEYFMLLDSAASNTWVMSSDCSDSACGVHTTFGEGDSTTLKVLQTTFSVSYGTGNVKGITGSDTAQIGSISVPLTFGLAQNVSNEFSSFPMDGIVGLGRPDTLSDNSNDVKAPSLMDALISEKIISSKLFAIDLWRAKDGGTNDGELNFGKPDSSRYDGNLNYIPAVTNANGFWEIPLGGAGVNDQTTGITGRTAIIDSGTSYILMPHDDAIKLHDLIPGSAQSGSELFTVPCDASARVQFTFGGTAYDISPKDYVGRQVTGGCSSNIIGRQTFGATQWLVGDVFMKNVYTVFDFDGQRVGFGVKGGQSSAPASSSQGTQLVRLPTTYTTSSSVLSTSLIVVISTLYPSVLVSSKTLIVSFCEQVATTPESTLSPIITGSYTTFTAPAPQPPQNTNLGSETQSPTAQTSQQLQTASSNLTSTPTLGSLSAAAASEATSSSLLAPDAKATTHSGSEATTTSTMTSSAPAIKGGSNQDRSSQLSLILVIVGLVAFG